ncbi:MAG TPA: S41 family peptidase [Ktedonobacteraceae bacterium]|nr:S41 family peptidase [Ktedonobacteraceae bacterium]
MSRYDDPRWYEEQPNQPASPQQPASDEFEQYPFLPQTEATTTQGRSYYNRERDTEDRTYSFIRRAILTGALILVAFFAGWFGHQFFGNSFNQSEQSRSYSQLFQQAWQTVDEHYVDRKNVNYQKMAYAAIQAMVNTLQDNGHSRFMDPTTVQNENQQLSGKFTGIGIYLRQDAQTKKILVTSTIPGAPAEKAGLKPNDVLTAVNGTSLEGKDISFTSKLIQGDAGTSVTLTVQRAGEPQPLHITMTRAEIQAPNVFMHYLPDSHTAHISIEQFSDGTAGQVKEAVTKAKGLGATRIILDLRNNPGGYLSEAVNTASLFLKSGNVLLTQDSSGQRTPVAVNGNPIDTTDQMVVLVNENSASAAEILAGALQDNKRATIIGTKTFGTGTVLEQFKLDDGSAILLGTQEWLTPNGHFIRETKISPDTGHTVTMDPALVLSPNTENQSNMTQAQILAGQDTQLAAALQFLIGQK